MIVCEPVQDGLFELPAINVDQINAIQGFKDSALQNKTCVNGHTGQWAVYNVRSGNMSRRSPLCRVCKENSAKRTGARVARTRAYNMRKAGQMPLTASLTTIREYYDMARTMTARTGEKWVVDHIKPLIRGGLHHQDNLQVIPAKINAVKGSRIDDSIRGLVLK